MLSMTLDGKLISVTIEDTFRALSLWHSFIPTLSSTQTRGNRGQRSFIIWSRTVALKLDMTLGDRGESWELTFPSMMVRNGP